MWACCNLPETRRPCVRVDKVGNLNDRHIDFRATVANPAAEEQQVKLKLFTDTEEVNHEETFMLPAGGKKAFNERHEIADLAASRLTFEVFDARGNLVHRSAAPFYLDQAFDVRIIQYPNYEKALLELNLGTFSQTPLKDISVNVAMNNAAGEAVLAKNWPSISTYCAVPGNEHEGRRSWGLCPVRGGPRRQADACPQ